MGLAEHYFSTQVRVPPWKSHAPLHVWFRQSFFPIREGNCRRIIETDHHRSLLLPVASGGLHFKASADCDSLVLEARATLARAERDGLLFPDAVRVIDKLDWPSVGRPNGGWTDARDRQLCLDNANGTLTRVGQASGTAPASEPGSPREGRRRRLRQRPRRH